MNHFDIQEPGLPSLRVVVDSGRVQSISWHRTSPASPRTHRPSQSGDSKLIARLKHDLKQYFAGQRQDFDWPLDWSTGTPFQQEVWQALRTVPYGETRSYQWLATKIRRPHGMRAVGQANGANPFSLVVPCHRIIRADGSIGGYAGGLSIKKKLLALEKRLAE